MQKVGLLNVLLLLVLLGAVSDAVNETQGFCNWWVSGTRDIHCNQDQFQCFNGKCIKRSWYCDAGNDCGDNSDEKYCNSNDTCPTEPLFLRCQDSLKCIPLEWICNGYQDCPYGDDEENCSNRKSYLRKVVTSVLPEVSRWLGNQRANSSTERWGPKVLKYAVLLYFVDTNFADSKDSQIFREMAYEVSIQLYRRLLSVQLEEIASTDLASIVNAFTVMCFNPRRFHGLDLVRELRMRVDRDNYTNPFVFLTLCTAGDTITETDKNKLIDIFWKERRPFWTDIRALAVMALACARKQATFRIEDQELKELTVELTKHQYRNGTVENLQTTALVMQALLAVEAEKNSNNFNEQKALEQILQSQISNGSFGGLRNTYYVTPILTCRSLVDINSDHCEYAPDDENLENLIYRRGSKVRVQYMLWIGSKSILEKNIVLQVPTNTSLYRLMEIAAKLDQGFRFEYKVKDRKPYVTSISGLPEDPEKGRYWFLYSYENWQTLPSKESPADVILKTDANYVFWYHRISWIN